jgi:acyl-CoA thioesterase-2
VDARTPSETLLELLTLEELDTNLYRAPNPAVRSLPNLFGGQVAAKALAAAAATVDPDLRPHSLHCYFLRRGDPERPTILAVDRDRDGRSYSARHVNAIQNGEVICSVLTSFHVDEEGVDVDVHPLPDDAGDPEAMPEQEHVGHNVLLELRRPEPDTRTGWHMHRFWVRPRGEMPRSPLLDACIITYVSDIGAPWSRIEGGTGVGGPSLDHAVWFQRSIDAREWMLLDLVPVSLAGARGLYTGTIHDRGGRLAAWITQESVARGAWASPGGAGT